MSHTARRASCGCRCTLVARRAAAATSWRHSTLATRTSASASSPTAALRVSRSRRRRQHHRRCRRAARAQTLRQAKPSPWAALVVPLLSPLPSWRSQGRSVRRSVWRRALWSGMPRYGVHRWLCLLHVLLLLVELLLLCCSHTPTPALVVCRHLQRRLQRNRTLATLDHKQRRRSLNHSRSLRRRLHHQQRRRASEVRVQACRAHRVVMCL
jgi:hypothetical protein